MQDKHVLILFIILALLTITFFLNNSLVSVVTQSIHHFFHPSSNQSIKLYAHHQSQLNQSSSNQSQRYYYEYTHTSASFNYSNHSTPAPAPRGGGLSKVPQPPSNQSQLNHHQSNHYQSNQSVSSNQQYSNSYEYNNNSSIQSVDYNRLLSALFSLPAPAPQPGLRGGELVWITNNSTLEQQSELVEIELDNLFKQPSKSAQPGFVSRLNQYIVQTSECYNVVLTYSLIHNNQISFYVDNSLFTSIQLPDTKILTAEIAVAQSDKINQNSVFVYKITFVKNHELFVLLNYNNQFSKTFSTDVVYTQNSKTLILARDRIYALTGDYIIMYNVHTHQLKTFRLFKPHSNLYVVHAYLFRAENSIVLLIQFQNNVYYIKLSSDLSRVLAFHTFKNTQLIFAEYLIKSDLCNSLSSYYILTVLEQGGHFYTLIINQMKDKVVKIINNAYSSAEVLDNKIVLMHLLLFSSNKYYLQVVSYQSTTLEMNLYFYAFDKQTGAFVLASGGWTSRRAYNQLINYFTLLNVNYNQLFTITQA